MWSSIKSLRSLVVDVLCNGRANRLLELENQLEKHKKILLHPITLPEKSASDRELVKKASKDAVSLKEIQQKVLLTADLIDEALLVSDILNLNEIFAVELLLTGALKKFDIVKEFNHLENAQALGDSKHRHDIYMLLRSIDNNLSECIMLWACQSAFNLNEFKQVLDHILLPIAGKISNTGDASVIPSGFKMVFTHRQVHLLMSLLYSLQPFSLIIPFPEQLSDLTDFDLLHPLFADRGFASSMTRLLDEKKSLFERQSEESTDQIAILACLRLAWALSLRRSSHLRAELRRRRNNGGSSPDPQENLPETDEDFSAGGDDEDESQAGMAIESGALEFIRKQILPVTGFEKESLWVHRIHNLVTDLIVYMPARVKEIRMRDEDLLRCTGFDPSTTGHGFANFLLLIAQLYNHPGSQFHARLALEFWWPMGEAASGTVSIPASGEFLSPGLPSRSPSKLNTSLYAVRSRTNEMENVRQAALFRFVRTAGDMASTPCLFLPYLRMIHGLTCSRSAAQLCFSLLKTSLNSQGRGASLITWDHFFASFRQYLAHMKQSTIQQPEQTVNRAPNQLYHHLYFADSANTRSLPDPISRWANTNRLAMRKTSTGLLAESMPTMSGTNQPSAIQPEEQAGLQAILRLVSRICCMDPVSRSSFASNPQWQVIPICVGFLTCSLSLELKADLIQVLSSLSRSQPIANVVWREFINSELLPFINPRPPNQVQMICGLHTDMDEVEPRAEEYPITRAFLALMTTLIPRVGILPLSSIEPKENHMYLGSNDDLAQANSFVGLVSFITNTIFLRHTMRAYRDPDERWDIAASCLVLFDGLIGDFLRNLNNAIAVITSPGSGQRTTPTSDSLFIFNDGSQSKHAIAHSPDWASNLINALDQLDKEHQTIAQHGRVRSGSTPVGSLAQLRLPCGWPLSDPGYLLVTQLFSDSSLFRMVTGLLEVGLHRLLEFPIPNGPPVGMTRATMAGLRIICQLLANEDVLVTFIRRTATTFQPGFGPLNPTAVSVPLPTPSSFGMTVLPICLSRLLMSVNSGTGTADLIPMLLKYCYLADYLPEHSTCAVNILGLLVGSIKPHADLLALLVADLDVRRHLLSTFANLLKWPIRQDTDIIEACAKPSLDNDGFFKFTDEWIYGGSMDPEPGSTQLMISPGVPSTEISHPATLAAVTNAAFPIQTSYWYFPDQDWEFWAAWPIKHRPMDPVCAKLPCVQSDYYGVAFGSWLFQSITNQHSVPMSMRLLHILLAALDQPAPNLSHWLFGFRIDSIKAISHTTLQDAGIGDQPRTCLHGVLDIIDTASRFGHQASLAVPFEYSTTIHWTMALVWQILYRLASNQMTSEPLLRFLRSNHDLLAKHLQFNLGQDPVPKLNSLTLADPGQIVDTAVLDKQHAVLESLILNQRNWLLRIVVIEIRTAVSGNQWSYVAKLLRLFLGDLLLDNAAPFQDNVNTTSVLASFLKNLNVSESLPDPGLLKLQALDASLVEELLLQSELGCCLLASDLPAVRNVSSVINPKTFLAKLGLKLITSQPDSANFSTEELGNILQLAFDQTALAPTRLDASNLLAGSKDVSVLLQWISARNMHRLRLYAGKQSAVEAWRQLVEFGLGLLVRQSHAVFSTSPGLSSMVADRMSLGRVNDPSGGLPSSTSLPPLPVVCLDVLLLLLLELCASNSTPQTMKLLASGTCLNLCSFLYLGSKSSGPSSSTNQCLIEYKQWTSLILSVTQMLTKAIMNTKSSAQRIRANYYGSLCYIVRFCRNMEERISTAKDLNVQDCTLSTDALSIIICANFPTNGRLEDENLDSLEHGQLHAMLADDLIHGHTITQMSAMSLFELIISFDRSSTGGLIAYLDRQGILQHLIDTIPEDLKTLQSYLTLCSQAFTDDISAGGVGGLADTMAQHTNLIASATSAYHLYQSKMSFLCRLANSSAGAKVLINLDTLNHLAACDIFSQSNLANCYSDGLDSLYMCEDLIDQHHPGYRSHADHSNLINLNWFVQTLDPKLPHLPQSSDDLLFYNLIDSMNCVQFPDGHEKSITWAGILLSLLRLSKTMLISLGPAHVSCSQQLFNLLYAHSSALMCNEVELGSSLVTFLSRNDWSYMVRSRKLGSDWLIQWISSESSLIGLFAQAMRSFQATAGTQYVDEYSTLQREVVHCKIVRHVLDALSALFNGSGSNLSKPHQSRCQSSRLAFEQLLIRTQQTHLVRDLLNVLSCYMSGSRLRNGIPLDTSHSEMVNPLFSFFAGSQAGHHDGPACCLSMFARILTWSLKYLTLIEQLVVVLVDTKFFVKRQRDPTTDSDKATDQRFSTVINQLLHCTSLNENMSLEELKQACAAIYECPSSFLTCGNESNRAIHAQGQNMESLILRRFAQIGLGLIRIQLRSLIVIVEQSLYIIWQHLSDHSLIGGADEISKPDNRLSGNPARVRDLSGRCQSPNNNNKTFSPNRRDVVVRNERGNRIKDESVVLAKQLPGLLDDGLFESITQLAKATYLEPNQRLFLQAMMHRTQRLVSKLGAADPSAC